MHFELKMFDSCPQDNLVIVHHQASKVGSVDLFLYISQQRAINHNDLGGGGATDNFLLCNQSVPTE